ncbi:MAG: succinate dehydrogenase cytochrome b subunit [Flavobacteriales bacterium]|jgi:succinate dehydrogenase / fumarate reductase cytochrome b subunit
MASGLFKSSLVKKFWMALTGLFLITFLVVHAAINAMIFFNDGGATFNQWGHFMGTNLIIRTMEIGLFLGLIIHIVDGLMLYFQNRKARPVKYAYEKASASSKWYSRSMALLGTLILLFLILHLAHFWVKTRITGLTVPNDVAIVDGHEVENLFAEMLVVFSDPIVVIVYVLGCFSLFWHLLHGFRSAFQSLGLNHSKYKGAIAVSGDVFSIVISILFASMPVAMYLGLVS